MKYSLQSDHRIDNVYRQYKLQSISLRLNAKSEMIEALYPMPKTVENMSYGVMPKKNQHQIALSPSLAKKFADNIQSLIGKEMILMYDGKEYSLSIIGIFNAGYDHIYISSDIEEELYQDIQENCYAISYDVKDFNDIIPVVDALNKKAILTVTSVEEVTAFRQTFQIIQRLFFIISSFILFVAIFISSILLLKLQRSRYHEIGLLSALGFQKRTIHKIVMHENILMSIMASAFNLLWIGTLILLCIIFEMTVSLSLIQILFSFIITFIIMILISLLASFKVIQTEPAIALRK